MVKDCVSFVARKVGRARMRGAEQMTMSARVSKFRIGDLALRSAWELERARSDMPFDPEPLRQLAFALERSSDIGTAQGSVTYMRPGYFEPFEKVYHVRNSDKPDTPEGVKQFVKDATLRLNGVAANGTSEQDDELVDFCLELHRAFVHRMPAEGRHEHKKRSIPTEAFFR